MKRLGFLLALLGVLVANLSAGSLRVGRAAVKITPPVGVPMGSSYGIQISEGVQDDLYAKALVLEHEGVRAAVVACDLISLRREIVAKVRSRIEQSTQIAPARVILSATHCHAGPQMHPLFLGRVEERFRKLAEAYLEELPALIAESVRRAEADLQPARVRIGTGREDSISFNRRFLMKNGSVRMNPGRNNPQALRPTGPIGPEVAILSFESGEGEPLALVVNFPLHVAVVGGRHFSSDFPGYLARRLAEVQGPELLTLFVNGPSGNVNHIHVGWPGQPTGYREAARIGTILAARVLQMLPELQPVDPAPLSARTDPVALPVHSVTAEQVQWAQGIFDRYGNSPAPQFHDVVRAWRILDLADLNGGPLQTEVQAITLGKEVALVGFPGDAFVELGLSIKLHSPYPFTLVVEQAGNGAISYVPNRKAFLEGGYEAISARFSPGGGERLVEAAIQLLIDLYPWRHAVQGE